MFVNFGIRFKELNNTGSNERTSSISKLFIRQLYQLHNYFTQMSNPQQTNEDQQFQAKLSKAFYKTSAQNYGGLESKLPSSSQTGINGKFTDHLIYCGMYKNASLNTTADKDRWVNGSKDWMEHLG